MKYETLIESLKDLSDSIEINKILVVMNIESYLKVRGFEEFDHFKKEFKKACTRLNVRFSDIWRTYRELRFWKAYSKEMHIDDDFLKEIGKCDLEDELKANILRLAINEGWSVSRFREELRNAKGKVIGIEGRTIKELYKGIIDDMKSIRKTKGVTGLKKAKEILKEVKDGESIS